MSELLVIQEAMYSTGGQPFYQEYTIVKLFTQFS